jgi:hypothetical protein
VSVLSIRRGQPVRARLAGLGSELALPPIGRIEIETLYAPDIISIEAAGSPAVPARVEGLNAVRGKNDWWQSNHEVHRANVEGPWPHGDRFIVRFNYDVTAKDGPMAGQRMQLDETALYTVVDGKIVQEEFFYNM